MKQAIINVLRSMHRVFSEGIRSLFDTRIDHMSPIGRYLMSNKIDRVNYLKAIDKANKTGSNVTFQLHTGEEVTLP